MPEEKKAVTSKKPAVAVPRTEISEEEAKKNRNFIILMIVIIVVIILGGGYGIYRLATKYIHEANIIKAQDEEISLLEQKQKNLEVLKPNYESIIAKGGGAVSDADLILRALPLDTDYKGLIATLEKMAQQSNVKLLSVTQGGSTAPTTGAPAPSGAVSPQLLDFTVSIDGTYQGLLDFLKKTEESSRVMNFSSMTLSAGSASSIQANITMKTFWQDKANIESTKRPLK